MSRGMRDGLARNSLPGPIAWPRTDPQAARGHPHFQAMVAGSGIVRGETELVLRVQFGAEFLDSIFQAIERGEWKNGASRRDCERVSGVGFPHPDQLSQPAEN